MPQTNILNAKDIVAGGQGYAYATVNGERIKLAHLKNITATVSYNKEEVDIMGKQGKGHKKTGETYSGSMTLWYVSSIFRELAMKYKQTGEDFYFDVQVVNSDATSRTGEQITSLIDVSLDSLDIAILDASSSVLEESIDFTFEDWNLDKSFNRLSQLVG